MSEGIKMFGPLAEDYAKYRPGYPAEILNTLITICGLAHDWSIADIGSGTGNLAKIFLEAGYQITAVEPNPEMRAAGERLLARYPGFRSLHGTAERIPIDTQSTDLITIGQALHWFDVETARAEFKRILRPGGWIAVAWNEPSPATSAFTKEYRALARNCAPKSETPCAPPPLSAGLEDLYRHNILHTADYPHTQRFDLEGFLGRARSSCFIPQPGMPGHQAITSKFTELFEKHHQSGCVEFHYIAKLHCGRLG